MNSICHDIVGSMPSVNLYIANAKDTKILRNEVILMKNRCQGIWWLNCQRWGHLSAWGGSIVKYLDFSHGKLFINRQQHYSSATSDIVHKTVSDPVSPANQNFQANNCQILPEFSPTDSMHLKDKYLQLKTEIRKLRNRINLCMNWTQC